MMLLCFNRKTSEIIQIRDYWLWSAVSWNKILILFYTKKISPSNFSGAQQFSVASLKTSPVLKSTRSFLSLSLSYQLPACWLLQLHFSFMTSIFCLSSHIFQQPLRLQEIASAVYFK